MNKKNEKELEQEYKNTFVQRVPRYIVKPKDSKAWVTKNKPLSDIPINAHLNQKYIVGVLAKWYPGYAILDFDDMSINKVDDIRDKLKLDTDNSMLLTSESVNSYHLLFKPSYNNKPPTIRLLNEVLRPYANEHNIEVYPQSNKAVRLPFGYRQDTMDFEYIDLHSWQEKTYWFNKLDEFDLRGVPFQQLHLDLMVRNENDLKVSTYQEGRSLFQTGLGFSHSRHDSQFRVLYYLFRNNIPLTTSIDMTWQWIKRKHNNYSRDIITSPQTVRKEIERQACWIYEHYGLRQYYPDEIHNIHKGYITKPDIIDILHIAKASLPRVRFLFNLIKFCYPRRYNLFIKLHSDILIEWSKRNYQSYLDELQEAEIIKRYDTYQVGGFSKSIRVSWGFRDVSQAILVDSRAPEGFEDTIKASFEPEEFRESLIKAGSVRDTAIKTTRRIFEDIS